MTRTARRQTPLPPAPEPTAESVAAYADAYRAAVERDRQRRAGRQGNGRYGSTIERERALIDEMLRSQRDAIERGEVVPVRPTPSEFGATCADDLVAELAALDRDPSSPRPVATRSLTA
jgi:hypothetical protein